MTRFALRGRTLALALLLSPLASCSDNPFSGFGGGGSGAAVAGVDPAGVTAQALRSAVGDGLARRFYEAGEWQAVWDRNLAGSLLEALGQAEAHGLSRDMFLPGSGASDPAKREAELTKAALDYAAALAMGRVDATKIREVYTVPRPKVDVAAGLRKAIAEQQVPEWLASLAPQTPEYQALSRAYLTYRKQETQDKRTPIESGEPLKPGMNDPRVPRVIEALSTNGYMQAPAKPAENAASGQIYSGALVEAVKRLQRDYGIKPDGVIGEDTLQLLNASAADRSRQLAVNLERLRWLERNPPATRIDVNTAATFLDYWRDGQHRDRRVVVVGQPDWETPSLGSPIFRLVANPTWTVPESIEKDELAGKSSAYFRANNMTRKNGRIVQMPGPKNSLGQVKLDMLNDEAIYLHDTPAKALFGQPERHRSHGCVRVANAVQFARLIAEHDGVLADFDKAMATGDETFVSLSKQVPVRLLYHTVFFDGSRVQFRPDAYGWDEDVAVALGHKSRGRRTVVPHKPGSDFGP
jgi:murein L,D-transpeptidase YcbB/YkuD